jgi:hypothetical protein
MARREARCKLEDFDELPTAVGWIRTTDCRRDFENRPVTGGAEDSIEGRDGRHLATALIRRQRGM